jgi:hypothetical protein
MVHVRYRIPVREAFQMRDDVTSVEYLRFRLATALEQARMMPSDIYGLTGLELTGAVMRLDRVREMMDDGYRTLHDAYDEALDRDRTLDEDRAVSGTPSSGGGVVADILGAASAGIRPDGSAVDHVVSRTADVA